MLSAGPLQGAGVSCPFACAVALCLAVACSPVSQRTGEAGAGGGGQGAPTGAPAAPQSEVVTSPEPSPVERLLASSQGSAWYGLYMLEKKVGHARLWLRATTPG